MSPIKIAFTSAALTTTFILSSVRADDATGAVQDPPAVADETDAGAPQAPASGDNAGAGDIASDITNTADSDAAEGGVANAPDSTDEHAAILVDALFLSLGGLTWEGLAGQARWAEAYIAGQVGRYDRARYDACLEFLADYHDLMRATALIDVELEVYLREIGILTGESNGDMPVQPIERPKRSQLDTSASAPASADL